MCTKKQNPARILLPTLFPNFFGYKVGGANGGLFDVVTTYPMGMGRHILEGGRWWSARQTMRVRLR